VRGLTLIQRRDEVSEVSIITAVFNGGHHYLKNAYESLCRQRLPDGWTWQWVVQEDGMSGEPLGVLPDDVRISAGSGRAGRACMARTVALSRATGSLIRILDADDLLADGALTREIDILDAHPEIGWTACAALDLHPDGTLTGVDTDPPAGPIVPAELAASYDAHQLSILGTTICVRRDLVLAVGGWPAVPSSEDIGLMLTLNEVSPGWFIAETGYHYRRHPPQSTRQPHFTDPTEQRARRVVMTERLAAMRRLGWAINQPRPDTAPTNRP
jgi:glycosyltransferase involved in cell wall biosynthesis